MTRGMKWFAALGLAVLIVAMLPMLWFAEQWSMARLLPWSAVVALGLWVIGAVMQRRLTIPRALALQGTAVLLAALVAG